MADVKVIKNEEGCSCGCGEKVQVKVYNKMTPTQLLMDFAADETKLDTGSMSALSAACSAALLERCAKIAAANNESTERLEWLARNSGTLKNYFIHLIEDDTRCRGPLRRAFAEGGQSEIDACIPAATEINAEIVNMLCQLLDLVKETAAYMPESDRHYAVESAELAMGAIKASISRIIAFSAMSTDETFRFVAKRENELMLQGAEKVYNEIITL